MSKSSITTRNRASAYERVIGKFDYPRAKDDLQEDDGLAKEETKSGKEIFFDALLALINNPIFNCIVFLAVIFNTIALILLTFPIYSARMSYFFMVLDNFFLAIYLAEAIIKILALGVNYFRSGWNILDFIILITSMVDFIVGFMSSSLQAAGGPIFRSLRALRALRALRMLRTITLLHNLQVIVNTVLLSTSAMAVVFFLMLLFMYMFAVMGRQLYAEASPYYFGDLFRAVTTMFQLLTFDSWFYMYDDVTKTSTSYWHFIIFAILYTLIEYFVFLNLFMAVLVHNFQTQLNTSEGDLISDPDMEELENDNKGSSAESEQSKEQSAWPEGRPTMHYNAYLEDLGHLPLEERILCVQFYNVLCALDYQAYVQKQNQLMMCKLLDKCQDPRLLLNNQADKH